MAYRDIKNSIDTAKQEGKNEKALEIAKNMLADGVDINLIKKYSGRTQEQIEKIRSSTLFLCFFNILRSQLLPLDYF